MARAIEDRLSKLELAQKPAHFEKVHRVIGDSESECRTKIAELIASGLAAVDDFFIMRIIVSAPTRPL
jgi:hypothetical protein